MRTIVRLKINPSIPIVFDGCHPQYYADTREIVIYDLQDIVQAVYDVDVLDSKVELELFEVKPIQPRSEFKEHLNNKFSGPEDV